MVEKLVRTENNTGNKPVFYPNHENSITRAKFTSLPNDKFLEWSKLIVFTDNINVT